ncbi:MAG: DUF4143 domain-containing protein [Coriobacteriales bacterium]|jgi:predicted AAA+ superfamily ATPase|nr:DUF4143 domain-containing protein [Coriobacteriales bacterium]
MTNAASHTITDAAKDNATTAPTASRPTIPAEAAVNAPNSPAADDPYNALRESQHNSPAADASERIWNLIVRGDLPELHANEKIDTIQYYDSYIETYLRRDVRDLASVGDLAAFNRFMGLLAQTHGRQLNKTELATRTGVAVATIGRWLLVLEASGIIFMLKPLLVNTGKRLTKSPKLYFCNSGLAARLCRITTGKDLAQSPQAGEFFEGFVIAEIIKSHLNHTGTLPDVYYYRDSNRNEIDLVLANGSNLYPIEIKSSAAARPSDASAFRHLDALSSYVRKPGAVICNCDRPLPLPDGDWTIPVNLL